MRLVEQAHNFITNHLNAGDVAIDATVGNGHDIVFLTRQVGQQGHVYGFDVQPRAIERTKFLLAQRHLLNRATLFQCSHELLIEKLPKKQIGYVQAVMFNLGYLPCSDKSIITLASTTLIALDAALECMANGACLAITVYKAHEGGTNEYHAICQWLNRLDASCYHIERFTDTLNPLAPELFCLTKEM